MTYQILKARQQWCVVQNDGKNHIQTWFFSTKRMVEFVRGLDNSNVVYLNRKGKRS